MTTTTASWHGLIARLDCDTNDGRRLITADFAAAHFVRLPVPIRVRPKPVHLSGPLQATSLGPFELCGRVDRVSIRTSETGREVHGEGVLDLEVLYRVRPDLDPGRAITGSGVLEPEQLMPVGIDVTGGELEGDGNAGTVTMSGTWELMGMAIEHQPSVWPGVGIQLDWIEMDGARS